LHVIYAAVMLQEQSRVSDIYEHVRDAGGEHDAQTMDAATDSQQQMMQMTEQDNVNDNNVDADKPDLPPEIVQDVIEVISVYD